MKVTSNSEAWRLVVVVTVASLLVSLLLTYITAPQGLNRDAIIPATLVPLLVAPVVMTFVSRVMLRLSVLNKRLEYLVQFDQMTGLLNRTSFFDRLEKAEGPVRGSLLLCDIDSFKSINDTQGHRAGDAVICHVANVVQKMAGTAGLAARFGGEEFILFNPAETLDEAYERAETIRATLATRPIVFDGRKIVCTVSIGVSLIECQAQLDERLEVADKALYAAKRGGRNRVVRSDAPVEATSETASIGSF